MKIKVQTIQHTVLGLTKICLQDLYPVPEAHVMHVLPHKQSVLQWTLCVFEVKLLSYVC